MGIRGCAVSMPFKESCIPFLDAIDPSAKVIDSVNTIVNDDGKLTGLNTDYIAVKSLIASHRLDTNARVMIQGSGGMGKAVIAAFRDAGFRDVIIAARNRQRGLALAKQYGFQWQPLPEGIAAEILVNVTPLGMAGGAESNTLAFSKAMVAQASVVFDVVALPAETPLIRLAQQRGKQTISGAEVLPCKLSSSSPFIPAYDRITRWWQKPRRLPEARCPSREGVSHVPGGLPRQKRSDIDGKIIRLSSHPVRRLHPAAPSRCKPLSRTGCSDASYPPAAPGATYWFRYSARSADADGQRAHASNGG